MSDSYSLITSLVTGFGLALPFGYCAERFLKTPALVGYVMAGVAASLIPGLPPIDQAMLEQLAEVGIMLLMFGVGLHFSVRNLFRVKGVALPGALLQMMAATILGALFAHIAWHWNLGQAVMFGLTISCASTVVVMKALDIRHMTSDMNGQVAIGWLVVQDLVSVLFLVLLPAFAQFIHGAQAISGLDVGINLLKTLAGVALFVVLMLGAGRKVLPWLMKQAAQTGSRELFTLAVLGCAIVIAYGASAIFHVSFALGAFFAGMVMQESRYAHRAATNSLPLQDAFSVLFFVSVGMMLDWHIFIHRPLEVLSVIFIIMVVTTSVSFLLVVLLKWPLETALTVGACLGQIGEFSFILAAQGIALDLADTNMLSLVVAASIVTIALNPVLFAILPKVKYHLVMRYDWAKKASMRVAPFETMPADTPRDFLDGQVIVVGCNSYCDNVLAMLEEMQRRTIVVGESSTPIEALQARGFGVIAGDASDPMVLVQAHAATAAILLLTGHDVLFSRKVYNTVRQLNPTLTVIVRVTHRDELVVFEEDDPNLVVLCEGILMGVALAEQTLERLLKRPEADDARDDEEDDSDDRDNDAPDVSTSRQKIRSLFEAEYKRSVRESRQGAPTNVTADSNVQMNATTPEATESTAETTSNPTATLKLHEKGLQVASHAVKTVGTQGVQNVKKLTRTLWSEITRRSRN